MIIKLNLITETQEHQKLLSSLIENSEESILCSGWVKHAGMKALEPAIKKALRKNYSISIISNSAHTHKRAAKLIEKWGNVRHLMAKNKDKTLHSKVYYFRTGNDFIAIVGSANLTKGGVTLPEKLVASN